VNKKVLKDLLGWGFLVWLIGYALGIMAFTVVPKNMIGIVVTPIGILVSLFILIRKIKSTEIKYYLYISVAWTLIAIISDYLFLVQAFKTGVVYYQTDVYVYYSVTFMLPLLVGWYKNRKSLSPGK